MEPRYLIVVFGVMAVICAVQSQDTIEMNCDPRVDNRFQACPEGYCCVRDEFLPTWVYCKKTGEAHEACTTRVTETNCPCMAGLYCHPNIVSQTGTASLYGKCMVQTTTAAPVTTTAATTEAATGAPVDVTTSNTVTTAAPHGSTPCPHGHSCDHHHTTHPHNHGHITQSDVVG